jgi:2'-5' RNA ligase
MHGLAGEMRHRHHLTGAVRPLSHLHITLRWINDYAEIPPGALEDVRGACEAATAFAAPFEVRLDRVAGWGNGVGKHPLVLTGHGDHNDALLEFQHALWKELIKCGQPGKGGRDFNPHVTLLYDQRSIPEEPVPPVSWMANEIVLVHSEVGATKYHYPGRWKLRG